MGRSRQLTAREVKGGCKPKQKKKTEERQGTIIFRVSGGASNLTLTRVALARPPLSRFSTYFARLSGHLDVDEALWPRPVPVAAASGTTHLCRSSHRRLASMAHPRHLLLPTHLYRSSHRCVVRP